jgi:glyoxylase-like metal-dependent hydrolase (beta-lactamase superfamily II)
MAIPEENAAAIQTSMRSYRSEAGKSCVQSALDASKRSMKRRWWILAALVVLGALVARGCALTSHPTQPSALGKSSSTEELLKVIDQPGLLTVETVASADWEVDRGGLINLERAKALKDGLEPIQVYFHAIRHPTRGLFIIDTGVEKALRDAPDKAALGGIFARFAHTERMKVRLPLAEFLAQNPPLQGVFFTHLHLDHLTGMRDVPETTPLYAGPHEAGQVSFINMMIRGTTNQELEGRAPLSEWQFQPDARFQGVIDVFGDGQFWALYVPGHTAGSTAYIARTATGPILFTGDTCHTRWGWENSVEPGSFTGDRAANRDSLLRLKALAAEHPAMQIRLGHQQ